MTRSDEAKLYRRVFNTPEGRDVLGRILGDLYHFAQVTNPEEVALRNYSMRLIDRIGAFPGPAESSDELETALVEAYMTKPSLLGEER